MKAPACGTADAQPLLSATGERTGLRIFRAQSSSSTTIYGVPLAITSVGRRSSGCAAYLGARSGTSCGDTAVLAGYPASSWAQQWVLEGAGKDADGRQLVYVRNQVRWWGAGVAARVGGGHQRWAYILAPAALPALEGAHQPPHRIALYPAGPPSWMQHSLPGGQRRQLQRRRRVAAHVY